jgi:hypothetical protein
MVNLLSAPVFGNLTVVKIVMVAASRFLTELHRTTSSHNPRIDYKGLTKGGSSAPKTGEADFVKSLINSGLKVFQNQCPS